MERSELEVKPREGTGKGVARKLRATGLIPAIFYGPKQKPVPLSVDPKALRQALHTKSGLNTLLALKSELAELNGRTVMLKEFQTHPLAGGFVHADLIEIDLNSPVRVQVPIQLTGHAAGVIQGGSLEQNLWQIEIESLPANIPDEVVVDVSSLEIGQSLHVKDVKLAEGVKILEDPEAPLATVFMPKLVVEAPVAAAVEGVPAEGEAAPAEGEAVEAGEGEKGEKAEKGKAEKPEKGKPEKAEKPAKPEKPGKGEKPAKAEKPAKGGKPGRGDRGGR
jgi:large subunit ribosomal protein L25